MKNKYRYYALKRRYDDYIIAQLNKLNFTDTTVDSKIFGNSKIYSHNRTPMDFGNYVIVDIKMLTYRIEKIDDSRFIHLATTMITSPDGDIKCISFKRLKKWCLSNPKPFALKNLGSTFGI